MCRFLPAPSARRATRQRRFRFRPHFISIHALREEGDQRGPPPREAEGHFYPRPPRGGRLHPREHLLPPGDISIHALREEGDGLLIAPTRCLCNFYPRPPRGGRLSLADEIAAAYEFLSTPSARRATCGLCVAQGRRAISIHALREEGDTSSHLNYRRQKISIHALREEGDIVATFDGLRVYNFYPRPPRGGRRGRPRQLHDGADFYPRPPRGGRPL